MIYLKISKISHRIVHLRHPIYYENSYTSMLLTFPFEFRILTECTTYFRFHQRITASNHNISLLSLEIFDRTCSSIIFISKTLFHGLRRFLVVIVRSILEISFFLLVEKLQKVKQILFIGCQYPNQIHSPFQLHHSVCTTYFDIYSVLKKVTSREVSFSGMLHFWVPQTFIEDSAKSYPKL